MPRFSPAIACFAAASLAVAQGLPAPPGRLPEYQVKAEYLGVLAEYVNWPARSNILDRNRPFVIGVIGISPFDNRLQETYGHRRVRGKVVTILHLRTLDHLERCDAVFICESEAERLGFLLQVLRNHPVLTLGDTHLFADKGVMINFFLDGDRVKFEVNLAAVKAGGFEIGSHLLRLARIVEQ